MAVRRTGFVRARKAAGFTQESFAEAMHVDRSTVARWEQGTREPQPYQRPKLARLLKITMSELDDLLRPEAGSVAVRRLPPTMQPWFSPVASEDDEQEALELVRRINASEPFRATVRDAV
jgi:transcriptional regulator with XRE-family HTH domain